MNFVEFSGLIAKADQETQHLSGGFHRNVHIRQIVEAGGDDVIAFACLILEDHIHLALAILYELVSPDKRPPIPEYYAGRVPVLKACWQWWALKEGLVKIKFDPQAYWVEDKYSNKGNWH